jgi:AraC-like DNA-binding protein
MEHLELTVRQNFVSSRDAIINRIGLLAINHMQSTLAVKDNNSLTTAHSSISRVYRAVRPSEERFRGIWEQEEGIAFIDRERVQSGKWEASHAEPGGLYHFYIQARKHVQCGEFNGIPCRAHCRAGVVQFVRPDETVHTAGIGETSIFQVSFNSTYLTERLGYTFVRPAGVDLRSRQLKDPGLSRLAQAHRSMMSYGFCGSQLYFDEIREAILNRILILYATRTTHVKPAQEILVPAKTRMVIDYIEANLGGNLRLAELCAVAAVSRAHFARAFRKTLGQSPHTFVIHRRLARAMELMWQHDLSIAQIARNCGFADPAHLTRCFQQRFGYAPSQLRHKVSA